MKSTNTVNLRGKIIFDPKNITRKHKNQSSWKYIAMVVFEDDFCKYYSWLFKKRFNLILEEPIRSAHLTFINDSFNDLSCGGEKSEEQVNLDWASLRDKWQNVEIDVILDLNPDTNSLTRQEIELVKQGLDIDLFNLPSENSTMHWWFIVPHEERGFLQTIRSEIGLGKPFFGMHMTIGRVVDARSPELNDTNGLNIKEMRRYHSRYLHLLKIKESLI